MKKIIGISAIGIFAMVLFANTNNLSNKGDLDLASLATLNQADAECNPTPYGNFYSCNAFNRCAYNPSSSNGCYEN
ncbi:hypothetical protein [Wocania ichthyoenteri]|uniref:hypothetical protein n=1 Tax=Wocania ichthyoenteri TaxID=1230531 RepID=UPI00053EB835|nr:hypothetical protein [Wocania ichthyoenteri]